MKLYCKKCGIQLTAATIGRRLDVDMKHLFLCSKCEMNEIIKLKQNRYVETYKKEE